MVPERLIAPPIHCTIRIVISEFVPQSSEMSEPAATAAVYNVAGTGC